MKNLVKLSINTHGEAIVALRKKWNSKIHNQKPIEEACNIIAQEYPCTVSEQGEIHEGKEWYCSLIVELPKDESSDTLIIRFPYDKNVTRDKQVVVMTDTDDPDPEKVEFVLEKIIQQLK